jgi:hypothetical protein
MNTTRRQSPRFDLPKSTAPHFDLEDCPEMSKPPTEIDDAIERLRVALEADDLCGIYRCRQALDALGCRVSRMPEQGRGQS